MPLPIAATPTVVEEPIEEVEVVETHVVEAHVVEPEIALASDAPEEIASEDMPAPVAEYARVEEALHEFVAASATRVLEHNTVATLAALVESVEAERELEPVAPRPAIRMRIGPPRARSTETPDN